MSDKKISALTAATTPLAGTEVLPIVQSGVTKKVATLDVTGGVYIGKGAGNIASNTVVGNLAGAAITTASNSVAIGNATSALLTTGIQNTAVGDQALYSNVTGNYNAAFGRATLVLCTGSQNSGFGWNAGVSLTSGANNAFWGHNAQPSAASVSNEYTYGDANVTKHRFVGGDIVIGTSGKGIDFSADGQAAGMTSELLDDYEEGTFTATLTPAAGAFSAPITATATYTKVGRAVYIALSLVTVSDKTVGTASGALTITGLPFTSATNSGAAIGYVLGWATDIQPNLTAYVGGAGTTIFLYKQAATATGFVDVNVTDMVFGGTRNYISLSATYSV
jgi:hypothetical protein